jgi:hypothetical protein
MSIDASRAMRSVDILFTSSGYSVTKIRQLSGQHGRTFEQGEQGNRLGLGRGSYGFQHGQTGAIEVALGAV